MLQMINKLKLKAIPPALFNNPIIGGITAPPTTAMIIKPEISLALFGSLLIVREKINGNRFPELKPTRKMQLLAMKLVGEMINKIRKNTVNRADQNRNR